jgi:hypothetical protein
MLRRAGEDGGCASTERAGMRQQLEERGGGSPWRLERGGAVTGRLGGWTWTCCWPGFIVVADRRIREGSGVMSLARAYKSGEATGDLTRCGRIRAPHQQGYTAVLPLGRHRLTTVVNV